MTSTRPQQIGQRYVLQRQIGQGGMGAVWLAVDDVLGRDVAVKRIGWFPGGDTPGLVRAQREARLAARLHHPHVVAVFDFVSDGDEQWLVMEYVSGTDLLALLEDDGGLRPTDAARLLAQVADALASAHSAGVVHRDVKPSNILVTPAGDAKLADFGIARARDSTITASGLVTGSPAYLAPEVASGSPATEASDVWSMGATLYHALSGRPPYDTTESALAAMYRIVHEEPPRLPDTGWPAELLETTMATDPTGRWSMDRVRDYLASGPPVALVPPVTEERRTAVLAASADTPVVVPSERPTDDHQRLSWTVPIVIGMVLLVLASAVGWVLLRQVASPGAREDPQSSPSTSAGVSESPTPAASPTESSATPPPESSPPAETATAAPGSATDAADEPPSPRSQVVAMRSFVEQYVRTALTDPATSWEQLTPRFQQDCCDGSEGNYAGYWNTIATATLRDVVADPASMQVRYTITWDPEGARAPEDELVTLGLVRQDGRYLIDYEL